MLNRSEQSRRELEIQVSNSKAREEEFHLAFGRAKDQVSLGLSLARSRARFLYPGLWPCRGAARLCFGFRESGLGDADSKCTN